MCSSNVCSALDLIVEIIEHTGAYVLRLGHLAWPEDILAICLKYRPTTLTGDTSQIIQFASFVESSKTAGDLCINKILYTSESMSRLQRSYIQSVFGQGKSLVVFSSILGSAEIGTWAVGTVELTGPQEDDTGD